jgi:hypothetical protein
MLEKKIAYEVYDKVRKSFSGIHEQKPVVVANI